MSWLVLPQCPGHIRSPARRVFLCHILGQTSHLREGTCVLLSHRAFSDSPQGAQTAGERAGSALQVRARPAGMCEWLLWLWEAVSEFHAASRGLLQAPLASVRNGSANQLNQLTGPEYGQDRGTLHFILYCTGWIFNFINMLHL